MMWKANKGAIAENFMTQDLEQLSKKIKNHFGENI